MSTRTELENLGKRILRAVKSELYFDMPYLTHAIGNLSEVMDLNTRAVGTDGRAVRFHPQYLFENYVERPGKLDRAYMHMLLHNLLLHPWSGLPKEWAPFLQDGLFELTKFRQQGAVLQNEGQHKTMEMETADNVIENEFIKDLWNLSCDIAVESIVDSMDVACLRIVTSDLREEWYQKLAKEIRTLTAERIFVYLSENPPDGETLVRLEKEFWRDDHSFWEKLSDEQEDNENELPEDMKLAPMTNLPLKEVWEQAAKAVQTEVDLAGNESTGEAGRLSWSLKLKHTAHRDFRALLEKYMVRREVASVDPEAFDVAYYQYGMERYGNMPLIEELEGREEKRLETLVIAIDTSASTKRTHVEKFLTETVGLLRQSRNFFERVNIHIVECDDRVQKDIGITRPEQIEDYAKEFTVAGGYGTDYRPVFSYVNDLRKEGRLLHMSALLYFTDGYGVYPSAVTDYDTAFVFVEEEDYDDTKVPAWAMKLYLRAENGGNER
ncbi:MAG: hypothetical protein IJ682_07425 [Lachnospiraceae bacterium]|nr:hypothetical protein [Lachnospiraceae bacterium]